MSIKIYVKYVKNNRGFHTTKLNLPTGNLDSNTSLQVIKTLVHINETLNKTVVMVTHDPKMASYGKRTLFLKDGVILDSLIKKESNEKYYEKILNKMVQI